MGEAPLRIAFLCEAMVGHLNPLRAIAKAFEKGGAVCCFFVSQLPDIKTDQTNIVHITASSDQQETGHRLFLEAVAANGVMGAMKMWQFHNYQAAIISKKLPALLEQFKPDVIVADPIQFVPPYYGLKNGIPWVTVWTGAPFIDSSPPPFTYGFPRSKIFTKLQHFAASMFLQVFMKKRIQKAAAAFETQSLPASSHLSEKLQLIPLIPELNFNTQSLGPSQYYTGCLTIHPKYADALRREDKHYDVYVSLGTLCCNKKYLTIIAQAVQSLNLRTLISMGGNCFDLNGYPMVTVSRFVDQPLALAQSKLFITHGGINSVMESSMLGTPMILLPQGADQPAIASRVQFAGNGILVKKFTREKIIHALQEAISSGSIQTSARYIQQQLYRHDGPAISRDKIMRLLNPLPANGFK